MSMNVNQVFEETDTTKATGEQAVGKTKQQITAGGAHMYALARNLEVVSAAKVTTDYYGFVVSTAPTADDTKITPIDGTEKTGLIKETFTVGQVYPIHGTDITVGTGGVFILFVA